MDLGWNEPAPASKDEVVEVLRDALARVEEGDSFEGFIEWSMPTPDPAACPTCGGDGDEPGYDAEACRTCGGKGHVEKWLEGFGPDVEFGLRARYRVGNSMGQGGLRVFTKPRTEREGA